MEGPNGPSPCTIEAGRNENISGAMERLTVDNGDCLSDSCKCDRLQGEVKVQSKRFGRGAVESGKDTAAWSH